MKMRFKKLLALIMVFAMILSLNMGMGFATNTNYASADDEGTVVMNISYGDKTVAVTDTELSTLDSVTATYSGLTKANVASSTQYTGVKLTDLLGLEDIDTADLDDSQTLTFADGTGYTKSITVKDLLRTTRYSYELVDSALVDNDNKAEVTPIVTSAGLLVIGQTATTDYNKQYWVSGLYQVVTPAITISGDLWTGDVATSFQSGSGTSEDPYMITKGSQLAYLASQVNDGTTTYDGVYFKLGNDLNLNNQIWTPIGGTKNSTGYATYQFKGIFDGNSKTIKGLNVQWNSDFAGLFGYNQGTIKNLTVKGAVTVDPDGTSVEGVADYVGGVVGFNAGTIKRVVADVAITANQSNSIGGIAGFNTSGKYMGYTDKDVQCTITGAVGLISECGNEGDILGCKKMGGMTGENAGTVSRCYNHGDITSTYSGTMNGYGGIVGRNGNNNAAYETGTVVDCYNTGAIGPYLTDSRAYGGISGFSNTLSTIINCYTTGTIKAGYKDYYPLSARMDSPSTAVVNSYGLDTIIGYDTPSTYTTSYYGIEKTETEMKASSFLTDLGGAFVADNTGDAAVNNGYPILRWQSATSATATVTKVEMTTQPTTTSYVSGQTFSTDGMVLTATYSDSSTEILTKADYTVSNTAELAVTDTEETISGSFGGVDFSFNVPITVVQNDLQSIKVTTGPTKIAYEPGDVFDPTGMVIYAYYTNGKSARLTTDFTCTDTTLSNDQKTITVSYEMPDTNTVKTDSFDVTIVTLDNKPQQDTNGTYLITSAAELNDFSTMVGQLGEKTLNAKLSNDIDLSAVTFAPIGAYVNKTVTTTNGGSLYYGQYNAYTGTFDGNGKTLTLALSGTTNVGLFGYIGSATIQDLTVEGSVTATGANAAGIVAQVYSASPTLTNCINKATVSGTGNVGGIVGSGSGTTILDCRNEGAITGTSNYVGGIGGNAGSTTITGCVNKGTITGLIGTGGIAGLTSGAISTSGNIGVVTGTANVGGIAGAYNVANGTLQGCYNTGDVTGTYSVGGMYGTGYGAVIQNCYNWGDIAASEGTESYGVGGIIGTQGNYAITDMSACYNTGTITGSNGIIATGALVGLSKKGGKISNSYYLTGSATLSVGTTTTGFTTIDESVAKSSADMATLNENLGSAYVKTATKYPVLAWQLDGTENVADLLQLQLDDTQQQLDDTQQDLEDANETIDDLTNDLDTLQDQLDAQTNYMNQQMDALKLELATSKVSSDVTAKATSSNYNTVAISWTKISGASGYVVYRYDSATKKYILIKTITGSTTVTYKDTGRTTGTVYYYKVRAYSQYTDSNNVVKTVYGSYSDSAKAKPIPSTVSSVTLKAGSKSATISWGAVTGATGYQISVNTKSSTIKIVKTITSGKTVKYTKTSLKKGTKYYVRVRAYRTVNGNKIYGNWSTVKAVTAK